MEIPVSPIEIEPVKVAAFLCIVCLENVSSLDLSKYSGFKRSSEFVIEVTFSIPTRHETTVHVIQRPSTNHSGLNPHLDVSIQLTAYGYLSNSL